MYSVHHMSRHDTSPTFPAVPFQGNKSLYVPTYFGQQIDQIDTSLCPIVPMEVDPAQRPCGRAGLPRRALLS